MVVWLPVGGFPEYSVSNTGLIRNIEGKILSNSLTSQGYVKRTLVLNGRRTTTTVHRLVALAHIPNPNNLPQINHIDCDKTNNHVSNLEWCTSSYNQQHAWDNGLKKNVPKPPIKKRVMTKLRNPDGIVEEYDIIALAAKLGVGRFHFYSVANGNRKQHCGYTTP